MLNFGTYLRDKRKAAGISQERLAELVTSRGFSVTGAFVSNIERSYYKRKDGTTTPAARQFVEIAADVLDLDIDEALMTAGYAPRSLTAGKPQTLDELLSILERAGVSHIEFADADRLRNASPRELQEVLDAVSVAVTVALSRINQKEATDVPRPALPPASEQQERE